MEPDGLVVKGKSGISKIYFAELPKGVQQRFHYEPQKLGASAASLPHVGVSTGPTAWSYSEYQDKMGRGTTKLAQVVSLNTVHFKFPYEGETHAALKLRKGPEGQDVMLKAERGQFVSSYSKDFITVRFDGGELWKFDIGEAVEATTGLLFIHNEEEFINHLRNAKSLQIEADFYQEGHRVFEFDVHGLDW